MLEFTQFNQINTCMYSLVSTFRRVWYGSTGRGCCQSCSWSSEQENMFSLPRFAVPSLQGGHGFSLLYTMFAKNMSTVFTEPSRCELRFHREKRWKQVAPHGFLLSRCLFSSSHRLQYYSTALGSGHIFFLKISPIADGPHHYHPACVH